MSQATAIASVESPLIMLVKDVLAHMLTIADQPRVIVPRCVLAIAGPRGGYIFNQAESEQRAENWMVEMLRQVNRSIAPSVIVVFWHHYTHTQPGAPDFKEADTLYAAARSRHGESAIATVRLDYSMTRHGKMPLPPMATSNKALPRSMLPDPFVEPLTEFNDVFQAELAKIVRQTASHFREQIDSFHLQPLAQWLGISSKT